MCATNIAARGEHGQAADEPISQWDMGLDPMEAVMAQMFANALGYERLMGLERPAGAEIHRVLRSARGRFDT